MVVRGSRSCFYPDTASSSEFNELVLKGERVSLDHIQAQFNTKYCLLEVNNLEGTNKQCRGHLAMVKFKETFWRLGFIWKLVPNAPVEVFIWNGSIERNYPDVLLIAERKTDLEFHVVPQDSLQVTFVNFIANKEDRAGMVFTSDAFNHINKVDGKLECSHAGPCSIYLPNPRPTSSTSNKRKQRGNRGSRGRKAKKQREAWLEQPSKTNTMFQVIYVLRCSNHSNFVEPDTVLIPFVEPCSAKMRRFGIVPTGLLANLPSTFPSKQFNENLNRISKRIITQLVFDPQGMPLRVMLVNQDQFHELHSKMQVLDLEWTCHGSNQYLCGTSNEEAIDLTGVMISCWMQCEHIEHKAQVDYTFTQNVYNVVGRGFGDRSCSKCVGTNVYFGKRYSARPLPTPNCGPGMSAGSNYYRQSYRQPHVQAVIQSRIQGLGYHAVSFAKRVNPTIMAFIGTELCTKNIWTQGYGSPSSVQQNQRKPNTCAVLAFANASHKDKCDLLSTAVQDKWMEEVKNTVKVENDPFIKNVCYKIEEIKDTIGLGLPTTCAYMYCWENEPMEEEQIEQYFSYGCLGICVPI